MKTRAQIGAALEDEVSRNGWTERARQLEAMFWGAAR